MAKKTQINLYDTQNNYKEKRSNQIWHKYTPKRHKTKKDTLNYHKETETRKKMLTTTKRCKTSTTRKALGECRRISRHFIILSTLLQPITTKILSSVPYPILNLSWNFLDFIKIRADKQTNKQPNRQTDQRRWKHNLLGGGKNRQNQHKVCLSCSYVGEVVGPSAHLCPGAHCLIICPCLTRDVQKKYKRAN